jgi:hypothetical protein
MNKDEFLSTVVPALLSFLSVAVPALLAWMGTIFKSWKDKQNEQVNRQALHSALETGAQAARAKYGANAHAETAKGFVADYVHKSVPDALKKLKTSNEVLTKLVSAKIQKQKENCDETSTPAGTHSAGPDRLSNV